MADNMEIRVNPLPSRTWNWLKMNDSPLAARPLTAGGKLAAHESAQLVAQLRRLLILRVCHSLLKLLLELLLALCVLRRLRAAEPDVRRALVEQVERLVRQEAICQIAA